METFKENKTEKKKKQEEIKNLPISQLMYYPFTLGTPQQVWLGTQMVQDPNCGAGLQGTDRGAQNQIQTAGSGEQQESAP